MSTTLHSFIDIFDPPSQEDPDSITVQKIVIPQIQRDYAQGRNDPEAGRVRGPFLNALYDAVTNHPITLDFVYGDIDENGIMTPLDGQQRLTTLFLLHWYAAKKEKIPSTSTECACLKRFSYQVRVSARSFCEKLVEEYSPSFSWLLLNEREEQNRNPSLSGPLPKEIIDQEWFPLSWKKDATIKSMLLMLDAIDIKFHNVPNLWKSLKGRAITFYFLPIKDMGLTDELYIKMNSRGKPLTPFEHFKAELEQSLRILDEKIAKGIGDKIDREWTDLLWKYRDSGNNTPDDEITDDEFLRYFHFICDIICYRDDKSPQAKSLDEFDMVREYFTGETDKVIKNIDVLESFFDCWCHIDGFDGPDSFLESCMSHSHSQGKIIVDSRNKIDIFEDCLHSYTQKNGRIREFPLNRIVLLYAVIVFLLHRNQISDDAFPRRLRIINNLIQNSADEISDRSDRNRLPAILKQTDAIMLSGTPDNEIKNSFSENQLTEEKNKIAFLAEHPEKAELVFALEDHPNLYGQISIIGLDHVDYADRFASLFSCDLDLIDCALMTIGDYGQKERSNKWRYQYGSSRQKTAWDDLFHRSGNSGFENSRDILVSLLSKAEAFTNDSLKAMIDTFLASCEVSSHYPWRYYYIKYRVFRPGSYGKYSNNNKTEKPYMFSVMQTKTQWSSNTYMPFLRAADESHLDRDSAGQRLVYGDKHIICENGSYVIRANESDEIIETIPIQQDSDGIDTEDRILKLKDIIKQFAQ